MQITPSFIKNLNDFLCGLSNCPLISDQDYCDLDDHESARMILRATENVIMMERQSDGKYFFDVVVIGNRDTKSLFEFGNYDDAENFYLDFLKIRKKHF